MYKKEIQGNKIIYKDKDNKEIEVLLNKDPILDLDNKYNLNFYLENQKFLDFIIKDIQNKYSRMYYAANEYNTFFEELLTTYNFKVMTYKVYIPFQREVKENELIEAQNIKSWEKYMLKNINDLFSKNAIYLENETYKEYTKEHLEFMIKHDQCEVLFKNNAIIGSVCYNKDTGKDYLYIRDIYGDNKKIIKEIIMMLLSKYQKDIVLDVIYTYRDLLDIIKELNGEIKSVIYAWKRRN